MKLTILNKLDDTDEALDQMILDELKSADCPLSDEQKEIARELIEDRTNLCVTGNAGTGKTFLLNWLRHRYPMDVTASTGIAALHIQGCTIHSWSGIGVGKHTAHQVVENLRDREEKWNDTALDNIVTCTTLVIDEISMFDREMLTLLDDVMRIAREAEGEPFGGAQVLFFGDFLQLPPVSRKVSPFAFDAPVWEEAEIKTRLLTKVFRQKDQRMAEVLNKIRFGNLDEEVEEFLIERFNAEDPEPDKRPVCLHSHNRGVDEINLKELDLLSSEPVTLPAIETQKNKIFAQQLDKDCLAPRELILKPGARVMLVKNISVRRGLANGSLGTVQVCRPGKVLVNFDGQPAVEEISRFQFEMQKGDEVVATRSQYPLRLAYAITIHKSQGMTLDKVEADLSECFADGQSYVALSRAKTPEGLFLTGDGCNIEANKRAVRFYREECGL